jgi:hypothetical protein
VAQGKDFLELVNYQQQSYMIWLTGQRLLGSQVQRLGVGFQCL